jgi:hypothetical protein
VQSVPSPWRIGWAAARANFVPGLFLQAAAIALVLAYYYNANVNAWLASLAEFKKDFELLYTVASGAIFCGLIPWLFRVAIPSLRPVHLGSDLAFSIIYWGAIYTVSGSFYRAQAVFWGDTNAPSIIVIKVLCDMLLYTPIIAAPCNSIAHLWKANGFSFGTTRAALSRGWYRRIVMPNLVPNWMLWTPGCAVLYSLPVSLQLPMASLIGCFWALLCISIASPETAPIPTAPTKGN